VFGKALGYPLTLAIALSLVGPVAALAQPTEKQERTLIVGQQVSVPAKGVVKYSEGVQGIIDVRLPKDGREFIVVGLSPGVSTLLFIYEGGRKKQLDFVVRPSESSVPKKENIRLDFYFVELTNNESSQLGLSWPASVGGGTLEGTIDLFEPSASQGFLQLTGHALPRLDILQSVGFAKVSRKSSVVAANGNQAKFESGGEVNIPIQGSLAAELRQISFGTRVQVLPRFDKETGRIELSIDSEFSSLSGGTAAPGRSVSTLKTLVNVEMGQAVVLAGLRSQSESVSKEGLPLLSQIPVLGSLFGTRGRRDEQVQNVVFIVPSVVDLVGEPASRRVREALREYQAFEGEMPKAPLSGVGPLGGK